jgi:hypothetical protein
VFSKLRSSGTKSKEAPDGEVISSGLLPELLEGIEEREKTVILDVGSGAQSTVDFFSQFNGRIHFVDLYSCPLFAQPQEDLDTEAAAGILRDYLQLPEDVSFDICLFWDAFLRADAVVLGALSRTLTPFLGEGSRGYGFGNLHARSLENCRYGIKDEHHLEVRTLDEPYAGPFHAHTQQQLGAQFTCLAIQRSTLLMGGRLELLFGSE